MGWARSPRLFLSSYVAASLAIPAVAATGIGGLEVRIGAIPALVWCLLTAGVMCRNRLAWLLLSGWSVLLLFITCLLATNGAGRSGLMLVLFLMTVQTALLFAPGVAPPRR